MKKTLQLTMLCLFAVLAVSSCKKEKPIPVEKKGVTIVYTLMGSQLTGRYGYVNGPIATAEVRGATDIITDPSGNMYIADAGNNCIRKISTDGMVSTFAGSLNRISGLKDGTGTAAEFYLPTALALDRSGNLYVADLGNSCIRKITPAGVVTTLAGNGSPGFEDGTGANAQFKYPAGVSVDANGNVYVSDTNNHMIRKITPGGVVSTFAGSGDADFINGIGVEASFSSPKGMKTDASGNIYVADYGNGSIRKLTPAGVVSVFAGSLNESGFADGLAIGIATFNRPTGLSISSDGTMYVADFGTHLIRKITNGKVVTVVGLTGVEYYKGGGFEDGPVIFAQFRGPSGLTVDAKGDIYVADSGNNAIRKISFE